jgi:translation initiation factor IF-3
LKIPIIKLHHGFNYRIEHLKKNKNDKDTAKIVHNKEFMVSPWTDVEHIKRKMATYGFSS